MKLRNKKTGEVYDLSHIPQIWSVVEMLLDGVMEKYDESKNGYWFIAVDGTVLFHKLEFDKSRCNTIKDENLTEIGNHFETREEAEKAVEKLKAWKRLKDKGFKFIEGYLDNNDDFIIKAKLGHVGLIDQPDVSLLFGVNNE